MLLSAGCMGSDGEPEGGSATTRPQPTTTTQSAPTTTEEALPSPERWATPAERVWLQGFGRWALQLERMRTQIVERSDEINRLEERSDEAALRTLETLLAPARRCGDEFRRLVPDPPTTRLRDVGSLVEAACERYEGSVDQLLEALGAGDVARAAREQAVSELLRAATSFQLVNGKLPPGATQRLRIVDAPLRASHVNPRYGQAAGGLVEQRVEVRCWSRRDWRRLLSEASLVTGTPFPVDDTGGFTMIGSGIVNLAPFVCELLDSLVYGQFRPSDQDGLIEMAFAVGALSHEAFHVRGIIEEAPTECFGMQRIVDLADRLGVGTRYGKQLARAAWETYDELPPGYQSDECRDGGEFDLDPVIDGPWDYAP
jgi:hypothetical protein